MIRRRQFLAAATVSTISASLAASQPTEWKPRYLLGSCLYGYESITKILPEVAKTGATAIDIWPKVHGNQREQLDDMGEAAFGDLLKKHHVTLGCITQFKLGPYGLTEEMRLAKRLGCKLIVTGSRGPSGLKGSDLKAAISKFVESMKPHLEIANETGVTIAIENHGHSLIQSADSLKWLIELRPSNNLSIALAPYHLPQQPTMLARLISSLGKDAIALFYAWEHGQGCMTKLPKDQELMQLPGRGKLDFGPIVKALRQIDFRGWTEIFMHPFPRGIPIMPTVQQVTVEINRSRAYLDRFTSRDD